jgi:hypothetical protein
MKTKVFVLLLGLFFGCYPGKMVSTGYLVTVEKGRKTNVERFKTSAEVDSFVFLKTNLKINTDCIIGEKLPFYFFQNDVFFIYVEQQGVYQKKEKGKSKWRVYDEELIE